MLSHVGSETTAEEQTTVAQCPEALHWEPSVMQRETAFPRSGRTQQKMEQVRVLGPTMTEACRLINPVSPGNLGTRKHPGYKYSRTQELLCKMGSGARKNTQKQDVGSSIGGTPALWENLTISSRVSPQLLRSRLELQLTTMIKTSFSKVWHGKKIH